MKTKTRIISAFPCLGKTSLTQKYKNIYFDFEIYESRATKGMNQLQEFEFFKNCARNIQILYEIGFYEVIFITDDERLLQELRKLNLEIIHVLPNINNKDDLLEYKERVIKRSGIEWLNNILLQDINDLPNKLLDIERLKEQIYFVKQGKYIEDLVPNIRRLHDEE